MRRYITTSTFALAFAVGCDNNLIQHESDRADPTFAAIQSVALSFRQVSSGTYHTCGVTTDNRAYCWGRNANGVLGDGTVITRLTPVAVGGLSFLKVAVGEYHSCGLTTGKRAYCWGYGVQGQLGNGTRTAAQRSPVPVSGGMSFEEISAGDSHTCGVRKLLLLGQTTYRAYCWGINHSGQIGNGTTTNALTPVLVSGGHSFNRVSAGGFNTCALTSGTNKAYCWGNGGHKIGDGSTSLANRTRPVAVASTLAFRQISAGGTHACALVMDRSQRILCWGTNYYGQLGDGTLTHRSSPVIVQGGLRFIQISAGLHTTCGVTSLLNQAYCWGLNSAGQLGDGTTVNRSVPRAVRGGLQFTQLDPSDGSHNCGVARSSGYCWGNNLYGQLGDGTTSRRLTPTKVAGTS
jgi:alpha-tubulin suppressor-like RCC1 family protein